MAKKLVTICREGGRYDIYKALQITMAKKLDDEVDAMEKEKLIAAKKPSPAKRARKTYLKEVS